MTKFGSDPTFNSYHFSLANNWNQESTNASFSITAPGRVTDLNVFWDGDGGSVNGQNGMWKASDNSLELNSSSYASGTGSESIGGQHLHTTSHNYFFTSTHTVEIGFFRTKSASSVVSVATGGTDGQTITINSIGSFSGASSFNTVYGSAGKGAMRAYGNYTPTSVYVRRAGAWVAINVDVKRGGVQGQINVYVRRAGAWTLLNMIPSDGWGDEIEKQVIITWGDGSWENGIIRDEGKVLFGNYDPKDEPQSKSVYQIKTLVTV